MRKFIITLTFIILALTANVYAAQKSADFNNTVNNAISNRADYITIEETTVEELCRNMTLYFSTEVNAQYIEPRLTVYDNNSNGLVDCLKLNYRYSADEMEDIADYVNSELDKIAAIADTTSDYDKIKSVYDYFIDNYSYESATLNYDVYSLLADNKGTCCSLSLAFKEVSDRLNIPCETVLSNDMTHEWNRVYINGKWLNIDIVRGLTLNESGLKTARYRSFLISDEIFAAIGYEIYNN